MRTGSRTLMRLLVFQALLLLSTGLAVLSAGSAARPAAAAPEKGQTGVSSPASLTQPDTHCVPDWAFAPGPEIGSGRNQLLGLATLSSTDVWAVGAHLDWPYRPLIEHWNGTLWNSVPAPELDGAAALWEMDAVAANDIWAVGYYDIGNRRWRTLALHWDGRAWSQVPTPNTGSGSNYLFGITAVSANDVWAVGSSCCATYEQQTLTMHWNGQAWSIVPSPSVPSLSNSLYSVGAASANDVWAVGAYGAYDNRQTLTMHWDGTQWSSVGAPRQGALFSVEVISATQAWAVGYGGSSYARRSLIMRFNNGAWEVAPSPSPGDQDNILYDLAAVSEDDIWAVGSFRNYQKYGNDFDETLIAHWDGGRWTYVPSPNWSWSSSYLYDIGVVSASDAADMWATGESRSYGYGYDFVIRYMGRITYKDVVEWDYFHEAVRYLTCAGAVSGYSNNTFRPYNNTTRAQLSKIVVLAEGWPINTQGGPHFRDVSTTHPFYPYVETAYNRGVVSGYGCGTDCLEFRPGSDVTRAQLCKVVVLAEGWPINTQGGPHFRDVLETDPFYGFIETAYNREIVSGYGCGVDCLEFNPGGNATRGQICKIVHGAVTQP